MAEQKIYKAISNCMKEIGVVGKNSKNAQQGFMFRGIDAVMNAINPALVNNGIFVVPEILEQTREKRTTQRSGTLIYSICTVKYTFYAEDGSSVSAVVIGEGMDSGDKATNKAMSIAFKYACFQVFCIPTEEMKDPDAECHEVAPKTAAQKVAQKKTSAITEKQIEYLKETLNGKGIQIETVLKLYNVNDLAELTGQKFENITSHLDDIKKKQEEQK